MLLLVCCLLVTQLVLDLGPGKLLNLALGSNPFWLAAALVLIGLRFATWTWKWQLILRRGRLSPSFIFLFKSIMAATFVNMVTPSAKLAGGFFRAYLLRKRTGIEYLTAYGWVWADQIGFLLGKTLLLGLLLLLGLNAFPQTEWGLGLILTGAVCAGIALSWLWVRPWLGVRCLVPTGVPFFERWLKKVSRRLLARSGTEKKTAEPKRPWHHSVLEPLFMDVPKSQVFWVDLGLSALSFGVFCLSNAAIFKALGVEASLTLVSLGVMLGYLMGSVVGIMGGIGVTELFLIKLYQQMGIPTEAAAAGALLHRGLFYLSVLCVGGLSSWILTRNKRP